MRNNFLAFGLFALAMGSFWLQPLAAHAQGATQLDTSSAPRLNVPIPNLTFSQVLENNGRLSVPYLADYVQGLYRFLLVASVSIAIVMVLVGGLQYVLGAGSANQVSQAKERIRSASIGLVLLLSVFLILYTVNPTLTILQDLKVDNVAGVQTDIPPQGEDDNTSPRGDISSEHIQIKSNFIVFNTRDPLLNKAMEADLLAAAEEFNKLYGERISITSGFRSPQKQLELYYTNCASQPNGKCKVGTCNPVTGGSVTPASSKAAFVAANINNVDTSRCPHTSSIGMDAWCVGKNFRGHVFVPECQAQLTKTLQAHNFCRIPLEPWHFEYFPLKVSTACSTNQNGYTYTVSGKTYDTSGCNRWDGEKHKCLDSDAKE